MHGSGLTHIVWSLHEQFYASQGFNVLSVDLPGHGNSEGPSLKSIEKISDWIKSLMLKINIEKIIIIGHSQGGLVAIDFSSRYAELIEKIVLVANSYKMPVNQDLIDFAEAGDEKAVLLMMKWGYEGSKAFIGGNPVKKIVNSARDIREVLAVDLNACNNYKNGENAIKKINCPTLCIFGDLDKMVPIKVGLKMSEQNETPIAENNSVTNDGTKAETNDQYKNVPESRFEDLVAQKNKLKSEANEYKTKLEKFQADQEAARKKDLEKQGEYKTLLDEANAEIKRLSKVDKEYTEYKTNKRALIMETIVNDEDKAIAEGLSLDKLELFANRVSQTNTLGTPNQRPANSTKGTGEFGGYSSYQEWAEKDPDDYVKNNQTNSAKGIKIGY